jgi:hypothetical protein
MEQQFRSSFFGYINMNRLEEKDAVEMSVFAPDTSSTRPHFQGGLGFYGKAALQAALQSERDANYEAMQNDLREKAKAIGLPIGLITVMEEKEIKFYQNIDREVYAKTYGRPTYIGRTDAFINESSTLDDVIKLFTPHAPAPAPAHITEAEAEAIKAARKAAKAADKKAAIAARKAA